MKKYFRASSTVEVMVILVAVSLIISVSYTSGASFLESYKNISHKERAQLYALETFEQLEALRLTRRHQNYQNSWDAFLGKLNDGQYQIIRGNLNTDFSLIPSALADDSVREFFIPDDDQQNISGFYSRLERRIFLTSISSVLKKISVSIYWGSPGEYSDNDIRQVRMEALYSDQTGPAFVL